MTVIQTLLTFIPRASSMLIILISYCQKNTHAFSIAFNQQQHQFSKTTYSTTPSYYKFNPRTKSKFRGVNDSNNENRNDDLSSSASRSVENQVVTLQKKSTCWSPKVRSSIGLIATLGMIETAYLTYVKLYIPDGISKICSSTASSAASCSSVLDSPYANIQINDDLSIPLTLIGFISYGAVSLLSLLPMISPIHNEEEENMNRIAILCFATALATFSSFLLSLLFNVLHQSCPYCILSAGFSISLGLISWFSGLIPDNEKKQLGIKYGLGSLATTTLLALGLFFSVDEAAMSSYSADIMQANGISSTVVASANDKELKDVPPPPITASSSERSLLIAADLKALNSKMYGAYWCSHCYEQKQRLGKEAFKQVQYIECSKEGLNSQRPLCEEREVPGYPTWEIGGKLFPGEMYLDELEDIIKDMKSGN